MMRWMEHETFMGEMKMQVLENLKERKHLQDLDMNGRILLTCNLKK
jgi:hypothetical protein